MARILVVDDEQHMVQLLDRFFTRRKDYEVVTAGDGSEALTRIEEAPFDVVITDIRMEPMDGLELLKRVKALHPATEVIVMTVE